MNRVMITAHSGCNNTTMNSIEYINNALNADVDAIEFDIRKIDDDQLVLTHDKMNGKALLSLEEGFKLVKNTTVCINCDLKEYELEELVLKKAALCGISAKRIIFTGSYTNALYNSGTYEDCCVFINAEELYAEFYHDIKTDKVVTILKLINIAKESGYKIINADYHYIDFEVIDIFKKAGIELSLWTIDTMIDACFVQYPVVNITTNYPKLISDIINATG